MPEWILAKSEIEGWINIIIIALVVGGPVLNAILKTLIKQFSPKEEESSKPIPGVKIDKPVAKPMPGRPTQTKQHRPPTAKPRPPVRAERPKPQPKLELPIELPEILAEIFPDVVAPRRPQDRIPQPSESPPVSKHSDKPKPKQSRRVVRSQSTQSQVAEARKVEAKKPVQQTTEDRLGTLSSTFDAEDELLGHASTRIDPHPGSADLEDEHVAYDIPIPVDDFKAGVFHVDRMELRRAIILKEILSPPLALRDSEM